MQTLRVTTERHEEMVDITSEVRRAVRDNDWRDGALLVYCPHTTAAITVNEGADPDVQRDILTTLRRLVPLEGDYRHSEGNSDAHVKSSLTGCGQLVVVADGEVKLGTWQHVYFCEFDGPRSRNVWLQFLPGGA
ncbi:protein of unknown function UPF0047 [Desulfovibrio sp. X2]|uniref:secondary thiamine-phosphate synthase enzyme YjbQ n=1 Tax=Desulfovibrio sp. X2 TaxID=941449 RepID=UPI000358EBC2|nr:secondary thiamine-phosphate synthase enzyme YjbQ [Desulfovibrio sp. X2]EPR42114.1 protein of unknown function UPF0047 [Desulfovibrio sp. X2]